MPEEQTHPRRPVSSKYEEARGTRIRCETACVGSAHATGGKERRLRGVAALETKAASQLCTNATDGVPPPRGTQSRLGSRIGAIALAAAGLGAGAPTGTALPPPSALLDLRSILCHRRSPLSALHRRHCLLTCTARAHSRHPSLKHCACTDVGVRAHLLRSASASKREAKEARKPRSSLRTDVAVV